MKKKRKKIRDIVEYMLDTTDKDVINHYTDMIINVFDKRKK